MTRDGSAPAGPLRDGAGVAKFRHEAIAVVLRSEPDQGLSVLASRRARAPFAGLWGLPSGPLEVSETLEASVARHLAAKAGVADSAYVEQLSTLSAPGRDPFDRTIATAYLVLVPWEAEHELAPDTDWIPVHGLADMAFDHHDLVQLGVERLRAKLSYSNIGYAIAAQEFTISELAAAYAAILGHPVAPTNLQRILSRRGQLTATDKMSAPGSEGGRPAKLYRFTSRELVITDQFATLRPQS